MAFALDLSEFTLQRFAEITATAQMLPSRQTLADNITDVVPRLEEMGVADVGALRKRLSNRSRYPELAARLGVDESFLNLLNREVNAYRTKPLPLGKLEVFGDEALQSLAGVGIKTTRHLYERCGTQAQRAKLSTNLDLDPEDLRAALTMANLTRINGAGPVFARFLMDLGMHGPEDVLAADTDDVIGRFEASATFDPKGPRLRPEDIEYCKRFCEGLHTDIEW